LLVFLVWQIIFKLEQKVPRTCRETGLIFFLSWRRRIVVPGCSDKHILKHSEEEFVEFSAKKLKTETVDEAVNHIKLEPEISVGEDGDDRSMEEDSVGVAVVGAGQDDNDFLDRLLDDLDAPLGEQRRRGRRGPKKKKKAKPPTKDFKCSDCGKAFYFQKNLFTHVVERHGKSIDELPCLALVKNEDGSVRRRKKKYGRSGGSGRGDVFCDECGVYFKFASGLYNHRKRMHGNTEKKPCPHCQRLIKSCTLDQHVREEHGTPRFACQFCGKGFYYRSFMLNHQRLHTGDYKECICDLCGAVYKSVQVLNRHVRNAHQVLPVSHSRSGWAPMSSLSGAELLGFWGGLEWVG
jgi:transcription elongation factor Elf1